MNNNHLKPHRLGLTLGFPKNRGKVVAPLDLGHTEVYGGATVLARQPLPIAR
jgi:hypothetical protein